jgi:hypothetical protein
MKESVETCLQISPSAFILHTVGVYVAAIARWQAYANAKALCRRNLSHHCAPRRTCSLCTYLSISFSFVTSKLSSQPASMRILMPPSNSSSDCDAEEVDWAPSKGVKLNIVAVFSLHC